MYRAIRLPARWQARCISKRGIQQRSFMDIPTILLPPLCFGGLGIGLWTWKCLMMVTFQNKIIYMPGLPPNARQETIANYQKECLGIKWREERIKSTDNTSISLCITEVRKGDKPLTPPRRVYILYFQGNASSLPPRLPFLSSVPRNLEQSTSSSGENIQYIFVCCSYRGYWTSSGRPSEKGIMRDAEASVLWCKKDLESRDERASCDIVLWGQSIGAGVAAGLAAKEGVFNAKLRLKALILETPFLGVKAMLETLYPQKWLPYRHLWPFLRNHLDCWKALGDLHERTLSTGFEPPSILILQAGKDELVPRAHGELLKKRCEELGLEVRRMVVEGALHNEVLVRGYGSRAVMGALEEVAWATHSPITMDRGISM